MQQLLDEIYYLPRTSQLLPTMRRMPIHCKTFVLCLKLLGESDDKLPNCSSQDTKERQSLTPSIIHSSFEDFQFLICTSHSKLLY